MVSVYINMQQQQQQQLPGPNSFLIPGPSFKFRLAGQNVFGFNFGRRLDIKKAYACMLVWFRYGGWMLPSPGGDRVFYTGTPHTFYLTVYETGEFMFRDECGEEAGLIIYRHVYLMLADCVMA